MSRRNIEEETYSCACYGYGGAKDGYTLSRNCEVDNEQREGDTARSNHIDTALYIVSKMGHAKVVEVLTSKKIAQTAKKDGKRALGEVAEPKLHTADAEDFSGALYAAKLNGHHGVVQLLLDASVDPMFVDHQIPLQR